MDPIQLIRTTLSSTATEEKLANSPKDFCIKWNYLASDFSPRTPEGKKFIEDFNSLINSTLLNVQSNDEKLNALDVLKKKFQDTDNYIASPELKKRIESFVDIEIQRIHFADNVKNCPGLSVMADPARDCWRLGMDGKHQQHGMHYFENEHGYMQGMLSALNLMIKTVGEPLTADLYCKLHDAAVNEVYQIEDSKKVLRKGYNTTYIIDFSLIMGINCTTEGMAEFRPKPAVIFNKETMKLSADYSTPSGWRYDAEKGCNVLLSRPTPEQVVTRSIELYNDELAKAHAIKNDTQKVTAILTCIAKCCQDLDQHHVLPDGNVRTVVFLTMNKLLLQNGLSPTILDEPNVVDMFSLAQIADQMEKGQTTFQALRH